MSLTAAKRRIFEYLSQDAGSLMKFPFHKLCSEWELDEGYVQSALILLHKKQLIKLEPAFPARSIVSYGLGLDPESEFFFLHEFEARILPEGLEEYEEAVLKDREQVAAMMREFEDRKKVGQPIHHVTVNNSGTLQYATGNGISQALTVKHVALYEEIERRVNSVDLPPEEKKSFLTKAAEVLNSPLTIAALEALLKQSP